MGRIDNLIQQYCPEGVEIDKVENIILSLKTGLNPRQNFKLNEPEATCYYVTGKEIYDNTIKYSDRTDRITHKDVEIINKRACLESNILLFASTGTGTVGRMAAIGDYDGTWNVSETLYIIKPNTSKVLLKFLMHSLYSECCVKQYAPKISRGSVPHLKVKDLLNIKISIPPLPVQEAIVEILEKFDRLSAELQAELQARKQQYEYYRNQLLTRFAPDQPVTEYSLGELGTITRGNGLQKKDFTESGVGCIHYGQIYTRYKTFTEKTLTYVDESLAKKLLHVEKGDLVIACTSENVEDVCKCVAWLGEDTIVTGGHACVYRHNQNPKYMAYFFQTDYFFQQKKKYAYGAKVIDIKPDSIAKITIPLPSLEEQARIVAILDKFEALVNDLSQGLPAEIAAVQEQYEYYRNKLLTFKSA